MRNFDAEQVETVVAALKAWSEADRQVSGLALVGSWAQGRANAEADIDFVCIVGEPDRFRQDSSWMNAIDWPSAGLEQGHWSDCDYGRACSRHLSFAGGAEVEVSFVPPDWASVDPVDPATRRVVADGLRVVHDRDGLLGRLVTVL